MARSRSSFDVDSAVATAASLASGAEAKKKDRAPVLASEGAPLVRFASRPPPPATPPAPPAPPAREPEPPSAPMSTTTFEELAPSSDLLLSAMPVSVSDRGLRSALPPSSEVDPRHDAALDLPSPAAASAHGHLSADTARGSAFAGPSAGVGPLSERPEDAARDLAGARARLPDLGGLGPVMRCERVLSWLGEALGASDVFLADAAGLPLAGALQDTEARLAASGLIASAVGSLATALPGAPSQRFELHVGGGPFFQLIGFEVGQAAYVIGMMRSSPLAPRQAHAVRVVCRHALNEPSGAAR
jgi:hypothetical protein